VGMGSLGGLEGVLREKLVFEREVGGGEYSLLYRGKSLVGKG
jgi:hypothetical protein